MTIPAPRIDCQQHHAGLAVTDVAAAVEFYTTKLRALSAAALLHTKCGGALTRVARRPYSPCSPGLPQPLGDMADRRSTERRKDKRGSRTDVTRREYQQLRAVLVRLVERVVTLQRQVDDLRRKMRM